MLSKTRLVTYLLIAMLCGTTIGYFSRKPESTQSIAYKDRTIIQTQIKTAKGDVITKVVTKDIVKESVKTVSVASLMPKYSITATGDLNGLHDVMAGYRLIGNLWAEAGVDLSNRTKPVALMGIRIEF